MYFIAWAVDLISPVLLCGIVAIILSPDFRKEIFPPAPLALVNSSTGGLQKPKSGVLGSHGSLTGAPEKHEGEAVEQEAHNFVTSVGAIALSSTIGKKKDNPVQEEESVTEKEVPDPTEIVTEAVDANREAAGDGVGKDKAKKPMEDVMWGKVRPVM